MRHGPFACVLACLLALAAPVLAATPERQTPSPAVGSLPPPLPGRDTSGQAVDLQALRGKVVIVTFWASWCAPCRKELPVLGQFQTLVGRDALEVIAVNFKEPRADFQSIVRGNRGLGLTWVHDARGTTSAAYGINTLPHMFMLDHAGRVAHVHRGYNEAALPGIIQNVLSLLPDEVKARPAVQETGV